MSKQIARELRAQGKSFGQIAKELSISKSTASKWTADIKLLDNQKKKLLTRTWMVGKKKYNLPKSKYWYEGIDKVLTRQDKGRIAEAAVLFRLTLHKFDVFSSPFDCNRTDWLVDTPKGIARIQVKYVKLGKQGMPVISLTKSNGHNGKARYTDGEFDYIVGYDLRSDIAYIYTKKETDSNNSGISVKASAAEAWDKLK